ncbi:hypothetical protein H9651_13045 [Microbacterium sp. Sa4CUA7]|uniref:DUF5667 domain-containing protein n=1 Tax=Microbacterium pullorum TaxID=2762236 RepID=A0ABR8S505_9MICO|nr:hypothetical protein [Microbacterium pullorum]MBD7958570.1 hypothetical protein [Microbacterium pullorum]
MSTLADLFDDDRATAPGAAAAGAGPRELPGAAGLAQMLGAPRRETVRAPVDDTPRLVELVRSASQNAAPVVLAGGAKSKKSSSRGRKRTDWLSVVVAVFAIGVVSATAVFAGIQFASASPAAGALDSLAADEAALVNAEQALATAAARVEADVAAAREDAARLEPALVAVEGYSDEPARAAAVQALQDYRAGLDALVLPQLPAPYARAALDEQSLADVGAAIDRVQQLSVDIDAPSQQTSALRTTVTGLRDGFAAQMAAFGTTFPAWAEGVIAENYAADETLAEALAATAAAVAVPAEGGLLGVEAMLTLPALVDALREDHQRVLDEIAAEEEARENSGGGGSGGSGSDETQPGEPAPEPEPGTEPAPEPVPEPDPGAEPPVG